MSAGAPIPAPGPHGGDAEALATALGVDPAEILDLSATLNPLAPDVAASIRRHADTVGRYPAPNRARDALAEVIGVAAERVLLTNGGSEAIALVAGALEAAVVVEPEFSLWRRHLATVLPLDAGGPRARVRSNPNNPTGVLAAADEIAACWDEAFFALSTGRWTRGDADRGALVVGSLTKLFACPGLRLGYVLGPDADSIERLGRRQPQWSVNSLSIGVLPELLELSRLPEWAKQIAELRDALAAVFTASGFRVDSGEAPWILVEGAGWLRDALARQGVLVRDCGSFGLEGTVRIAVPGPDGLDRLDAALDRAMAQRR
jgi:histidinol-phosphate/aromatic aminotransferase/cobyric acid decarboxylase-like protein